MLHCENISFSEPVPSVASHSSASMSGVEFGLLLLQQIHLNV